MLGGYQILDLRKIALSYGGSAVNITDAAILNQLRNIREYIEKGHNYKKALNNALKPYLIRYRDQKVGETKEVSEYAAIESTGSALTYKIKAKHIEIEVVFEEKTDDDDNKYYDIKTAKYVYNQNEDIEGDLTVGGDIEVDESSEVKIFENIVDKDGHKRFIEGDITKSASASEHITFTYGKWSLSGSHLLIVICGTIDGDSEIPFTSPLCDIPLPSWILDKLVPLAGQILDYKQQNAYNSSEQLSTLTTRLYKVTDNLRVALSSITTTAELNFRIAFDLLIDNESQE